MTPTDADSLDGQVQLCWRELAATAVARGTAADDKVLPAAYYALLLSGIQRRGSGGGGNGGPWFGNGEMKHWAVISSRSTVSY